MSNSVNLVGRSIACTTLPVARNPAAGALSTSGCVLAGNQLNVSLSTSVAGDLSVHGTMIVAAPLAVKGVLSVLGSLRTVSSAMPSLKGLLVIGSDAALTLTIAPNQASPSLTVIVAQYGAVVGRFASVNVESADGCRYTATAPPNYGDTALTLTVEALSQCGGGRRCRP